LIDAGIFILYLINDFIDYDSIDFEEGFAFAENLKSPESLAKF
jgi:hypothetical protein